MVIGLVAPMTPDSHRRCLVTPWPGVACHLRNQVTMTKNYHSRLLWRETLGWMLLCWFFPVFLLM